MLKRMWDGYPRMLGAAPSATALVTGSPASGGLATGPVRVVRGPDEFDTLQQGEILVAPLTAPAWTPLFTRAAAVVTDVGSPASHASIIAREYGIPAIVGCGDATARLRLECASLSTATPETSSRPRPTGPSLRDASPPPRCSVTDCWPANLDGLVDRARELPTLKIRPEQYRTCHSLVVCRFEP